MFVAQEERTFRGCQRGHHPVLGQEVRGEQSSQGGRAQQHLEKVLHAHPQRERSNGGQASILLLHPHSGSHAHVHHDPRKGFQLPGWPDHDAFLHCCAREEDEHAGRLHFLHHELEAFPEEPGRDGGSGRARLPSAQDVRRDFQHTGPAEQQQQDGPACLFQPGIQQQQPETFHVLRRLAYTPSSMSDGPFGFSSGLLFNFFFFSAERNHVQRDLVRREQKRPNEQLFPHAVRLHEDSDGGGNDDQQHGGSEDGRESSRAQFPGSGPAERFQLHATDGLQRCQG